MPLTSGRRNQVSMFVLINRAKTPITVQRAGTDSAKGWERDAARGYTNTDNGNVGGFTKLNKPRSPNIHRTWR